MCGRASPESQRSKFTVVGLWDRVAHHTSQLQVYMYKVCHRTQQSCGCLEDEERNHMTIITKVGTSYGDHMSLNDDALEDKSFLTNVTRLSPPTVFEERAWEQG